MSEMIDLNTSVEDLCLPIRAQNAIKNEGIKTIGELVTKTAHELCRLPNFGKGSLADVRAALAVYRLKLKGESPVEVRNAPAPNGMDLRDMFAMAALKGIVTTRPNTPAGVVSILAYEYADAMMKAREVMR